MVFFLSMLLYLGFLQFKEILHEAKITHLKSRDAAIQ